MKHANHFICKNTVLMLAALLLFTFQHNYAQKVRSVSFSKSTLEFARVMEKDGNEYQKVKVKDLYLTNKPGKPNLPVKQLRLLIPQNQDVSNITVNVKSKETIKLTKKILPSQPDIPTSSNHKGNGFVKPDSSVYNSELPWPNEIVKVKHDGYFDGTNHIVTLEIYPLRYYPKHDYVEFFDEIEFTLNFQNNKKQLLAAPKRDKKYKDLYENVLSHSIDNPEDIPLYSIPRDYSSVLRKTTTLPFYEYVVITSNARAQDFNNFIDWKRRKGLFIGLVTVEQISVNYTGDQISGINDEAGKIRQYLSDAYVNGTVYALLGGDSTAVPLRYGCGANNLWTIMQPLDYKIPTDIYFADFDGDWNVDGADNDGEFRYGEADNDNPDYEPEIFVGRLLCSSSQDIQNWTNKLILYERNPGKGSFDYLTRSLMNEADQMQVGGEANSVRNNLPAVFNNGNDPIISETPSAYSSAPTYPTGANIITQFNNNIYGLWSWFNHGSPVGYVAKQPYYDGTPKFLATTLDSYSFQTPETGNGLDNLNNANFPAVVYSICCDITPFDDYSPYNWYDGYRNMGEGFTVMGQYGGPALLGNTRYGWVGLSASMYSLFAGLINAGTTHLGVAEAVSKSNYGDHYLAYSHNLIGCPETQLWTATPSYFSNVSITDNGSSITVITGVANSTVSIFNANSSSEFLYRATGTQNCTFNTSTRPLYITILAQNYIPFFAVTGGTFTQNITVPVDETLNIYPGATLSFASGTGILVNGKLNVVGNSSNSITFTKSGANNWNGIQFNSGSGGNLDYCTIQYAGNGIYCYNSSPTIKHSTMDNNSNSGLYCDYYSSPVLVGNNFRYNTNYGIRLNLYSSPNLTDNGYPGTNVIRNNGSGMSTSYFSNPNLNGYMTYGNSVFDNSGYEIEAYYGCTVSAQRVYWGSGATTYAQSGCTIDTANPLATNPNPGRSMIAGGGNTEQLPSSEAIALKIASDEMNTALDKQKDKKYDEAIPMFFEVFKNNQDALLGKFALCKIEECFTQAGKKDYVTYSKSEIKPILKEGTEAYVVALELETHQMVNAGLYKDAISNLQTILKKHNLNSEIDKHTLFTLGAFNSLYLGDKTNSDKYFGELIKKYPKDELVNQIEIIKSLGVVLGNASKNDGVVLPYGEVVSDSAVTEELFSNYPNPFNPSTKITFTLKEKGKVGLKIYDILGKEVANLADGVYEAGKHVATFNGSNLASGIYFYRLTTPTATITKKMMLVK